MNGFEDALARRLDRESGAPLVVAYSGGGDSTALLHLTLAWARRRVIAVTVDHGLNADSANWTADAGERARAMGADWRALTWEGPKPLTGVQAKARQARHALLAAAAREAGAKVILMGHTRDDVLEGEVMRAADAPGLGRLHEWSPSPVWPEGRGVFLLRPLLDMRRDELRAYLREHDIGWFDDPVNADHRYARVRARSTLSLHPSWPGLTGPPKPQTELGSPAFAGDDGVEKRVSAVGWADGAALVQKEALTPTTLPPLLLSVSGRATPPRGSEVARLLETIAKGGVATLSGCQIDARSEPVMIGRTPPRRGEVAPPSEPTAWMRYRFEAAIGLYSNEASIPPP